MEKQAKEKLDKILKMKPKDYKALSKKKKKKQNMNMTKKKIEEKFMKKKLKN